MKALILGIGGQDGSYLADMLLEEGHEVHGLYRRSSLDNLTRIQHLRDKVALHRGDITDALSLAQIIQAVRPDVIYNEADQDDASWSYSIPIVSVDVTARAVFDLLEIVRRASWPIRVFQPVSATIFGDAPHPQTEETPLKPLSPYACAKAAAYHACRYYREVHHLFVTTAIMYNHDSVRRGDGYLLQHIARSAIRVMQNKLPSILLGNPKARVDVGSAPYYMRGAVDLMKLPYCDDFIIGSGATAIIEDLARYALCCAGVDPTGRITVDSGYQRPDAGGLLHGDISKIREAIGFNPGITAEQLVGQLVTYHWRSIPCE